MTEELERPEDELLVPPADEDLEEEVQAPSTAQMEMFEEAEENASVARPDDYVSALADLMKAKVGIPSEKSLGEDTGNFINKHLKDQLRLYDSIMN